MSFINKLYQSDIMHKLPKKVHKKLRKKFNIFFVETSLNLLPKNNHPIQINLDEQEKLIENFNNIDNEIPWSTSCPYMVPMLKLIFNQNNKFNFLDFGGERIDSYLYLKKHFKNINYFIFNQEETNNNLIFLKNKYKYQSLNVLKNFSDIVKINFDFINFGSVIQYIPDYENILKKLIQNTNRFIYFSATHFFSNEQEKNHLVVKQVNLLHYRPKLKSYAYFFNFNHFINLFREEKFSIIFKTKNFTDNINYKNFNKKYGSIQYTDLLLSKN